MNLLQHIFYSYFVTRPDSTDRARLNQKHRQSALNSKAVSMSSVLASPTKFITLHTKPFKDKGNGRCYRS